MADDFDYRDGLLSLRGSFVLAVALGTAGCVAGWMLASPWLIVGGPLGAMALHCVLCWRDSARSEFADSLYFIGFLFTLISLAVSLIGFTSQEETENLGRLVSMFGLAVVTTIAGLAARIYLSSLRPTGEESLHDAEDALADAVRRFRHAVDEASTGIGSQTDAVLGSLSASIAETRETLATAQRLVEESLTKTTEAWSARLEESTGRAGSALEALPEKLAQRTGDSVEASLWGLRQQSEGLSAAVDDLSRRIRALELPADLAGQLREVAATTGQLREAMAQLTGPLGEVSGSASGLAAALREVETLGRTAGRIGEALDGLLATTRGHAERSAQEAGQVGAELEKTRAQRAELEAEVRKAAEALVLLHSQLVSAASYVAEALGGSRER